MYNSANVIMSRKNKTFLLSKLNESEPYRTSPLLDKLTNRIITVPDDGASYLAEMRKCPDSCVLLDLTFGDEDAVSFMRRAKRDPDFIRIEFVVICEFVTFRLERELYSAGAACVVSREMSPVSIWNMLSFPSANHQIAAQSSFSGVAGYPQDSMELEIMVTDILHQIGVPAHIKGYKYLRCAIIKAVVSPEIIGAVTKQLYPGVAECFDTTPSRVERAMRHAIEVAWDRGNIDFLGSYFGSTIHHSRGKPTNSEFIAIVSDKLRITLRTAS